MTQLLGRHGDGSQKLIHSSVCLVLVPLGLCGIAVAIHWLMSFI